MLAWSALQQIAIDLTTSLRAHDRYQRLLDVVRSAIPCDATALLALRDGALTPLAVRGLSAQVLGMRFAPAAHPRLQAILRSATPLRFAANSALPDPFDGLVDGAPGGPPRSAAMPHVHDCLGCPLMAEGHVVGVLTADALAPGAFDGLDQDLLIALGALAGAALHTARLIEAVEAVADQRGMVVAELTRPSAGTGGAPMIGTSAAMEIVRQEIDAVAITDFPVLILGETGVGKELVARGIHTASHRRAAPFIQVNCAALPESLVESELFGHVRGAFTGAIATRPGKFEIADGGTLFLDEIGELPLGVQAKLLRALQEGEIQRVGADKPIRVDVRILTATNRDLVREVAEARFRADLYHRLDVFPLRVPPLRERRVLPRPLPRPARAAPHRPGTGGDRDPRGRRVAGQRSRARPRAREGRAASADPDTARRTDPDRGQRSRSERAAPGRRGRRPAVRGAGRPRRRGTAVPARRDRRAQARSDRGNARADRR